jgi:hypothetical protein
MRQTNKEQCLLYNGVCHNSMQDLVPAELISRSPDSDNMFSSPRRRTVPRRSPGGGGGSQGSNNKFHVINDELIPHSSMCKQRSRVSGRSPGLSSRSLAESPSKNAAAYAGAKFGEAPAPQVLPLPPQHWIASESNVLPSTCVPFSPCQDLAFQLKAILQVA